MKILIIDDEPGIRHVCERALREAGHDASACPSADEATARLQEGWDLVLTDLTMPGAADGNELLRRARAAGDADVIMMTAYPSLESTIAAVKDGACDYLLKPFSLSSLVELVGRRDQARRKSARPRRRRLGEAAILFADLRKFTPFTESAPLDAVAEALDGLMTCLIDAVETEGGTLNHFIGDGALAVFGAPHPHPEPVAAAARAALRVRAAVAKLGGLEFGFGLNYGEVLAGRVGVKSRAEFGVIGSAVNIAARLEKEAGPGQILLGPAARRKLDGRFVCGPERSMALKGVEHPLAVSELLSAA